MKLTTPNHKPKTAANFTSPQPILILKILGIINVMTARTSPKKESIKEIIENSIITPNIFIKNKTSNIQLGIHLLKISYAETTQRDINNKSNI